MRNTIFSLFLLSALSLTGCGSSSGGGGEEDLAFTLTELNNHLLISEDSLTYSEEAMIFRFDEGKQLRWIDSGETPLSLYSKHDWNVVDGKLEVTYLNEDETTGKCISTKTAEDSASTSASVSCGDGDSDARRFLKPQPFSVDDLSGKEITVEGTEDGEAFSVTLTFNADGTYDSNEEGEEDGLAYQNSRFTNAVWASYSSTNPEGGIFLLAEGTITDGKVVIVEYDEYDRFDGVVIIETNGNIWTILHDSD